MTSLPLGTIGRPISSNFYGIDYFFDILRVNVEKNHKGDIIRISDADDKPFTFAKQVQDYCPQAVNKIYDKMYDATSNLGSEHVILLILSTSKTV